MKNKKLPRAAPVPDKVRNARRDFLLNLQAYQLGVLDNPASRRNFRTAGKNATAFERAGRMRLLQNGDDGTLGAEINAGPVSFNLSFKKSPRVFGSNGPLVSTVNSFRSRIEQGDLGAIREMDTARKSAERGRAEWGRVWNEMLPTWRYGPAQYALIKQLDPSFSGPTPVTVSAPPPNVIAPPPAAILPPPIAPPAPGTNVVVAQPGFDLNQLLSFLKPPAPAPAPGGDVALPQAAPVQAGMGGGLDSKTVLLLGAVGLGGLLLSTMTQGGSRRRRR